MALPGRKQEPQIKQKPGKQPAAGEEKQDERVEELSFEQMQAMGDQLKELQEGDAKKQLEEIRKAKEAEATDPKQQKKKKKEEKIDLKDIKTEVEQRKGGLPEHIAKLPENHPIRVRWEKGFRQREDGTWYKLSEDELDAGSIHLSEEKQHAFLLLPLIVLGLLVIIGGNWYANQLTDTREAIIKTVKFKGLKDNPDAKKKLKKAYESQWLPELTSILETFKKTKRSFSSFSDNEEGGSYIKYIKKHNKKFDPEEAMRWRTRTIRKPSE